MYCLINNLGRPCMVANSHITLIAELQKRFGVENVKYPESWEPNVEMLEVYVHEQIRWSIYYVEHIT